MNNTEKCPICNSDAILTIYEHNHAFCKDCHHGWKIESPPPSKVQLSNALDSKSMQFCKSLADSSHWVEKIYEEWPAPIAHEYYRLREILANEQQIISAIWQFTDVASLLIKFPAVVMAQWVLIRQDDSELVKQVRQVLLAKPLSMGDWQHLARDILAKSLCQDLPQITGLFRFCNQSKKPTDFSYLLDEIIQWRNDVFAHGALALDVSDFQDKFADLILQVNIQLQHYQDIWHGTKLVDNNGQLLHGWQDIRHRHDSQQAGQHVEQSLPLKFDLGNQVLSLSPLLTLKRCTVCNKQDVFIFDSRKTQNKIFFLDYLAAHKIQRAGHNEPELAIELAKDLNIPTNSDFSGDYGSKQLDELLQSKSLEAEYLSPDYLRKDFKSFLETHEYGVYWLRAPAHIGKSLFVHGLLIENLIPGLKVVNFHIRREYRYHPAHFKDYITEQIKDTLDLRSLSKELPDLNLEHAEPAKALSLWLGQMLNIYREYSQRPDDLLLLSLDGLDELNSTESSSLLDFIPKPSQLSQGCYVLLTSRLQDGCPESIWRQLNDKIPPNPPLLKGGNEQIPPLLKGGNEQIPPLLKGGNEQIPPLLKGGNEQIPPLLKGGTETNFEKGDIKNSNETVPPFEKGGIGGIYIRDISLTSTDYQDLLRQFFNQRLKQRLANNSNKEQLFQQVLKHSQGRFLYLSFLCNLLQKDYNLNLATLENLPSGDKLYEHYLNQLEQVLAGKQWQYIKRLLLVLTAAEQAELKDFELRTGKLQTGFEWPGISLEVLATWLGEAAVNSVQLVFALYSLKELLRVEKGRRYKLGLKGFSGVLQQRWSDELIEEHRQLAALFYQDWHERYEELELSEDDLAYRFRYLLAHTELSEDAELKQLVWSDEGLADAYLEQGNQADDKSEYAAAVAWHTCAMRVYERLFEETGRDSLQNDLAAAYMNRGNALQGQGELASAVRDHGVAIELREQLRQRMGEQAWPPQWQNDLAAAYINRGNALQGQGELASAVRDYGVAIELGEQLRQRMGEQAWPPQWQNDLAMAYMNRGVAQYSQGELASAMRDYGVAIELREQLRQRMGEQAWPPQWQNDLAMAYINRGVAQYSQGELASAVRDYGVAIELGEQLRQRMGEQDWVPQWQNYLAGAYMNRGNALQGQGELASAVRDYGVAIELREQLRQRMGEQAWPAWPPQWQNDLAASYMNRGVALRGQGELASAVRDYGVAIELREQLLFVQQFAPAIPESAKTFYNLILLGQREDLPAKFQPQQWHNQATEFLQRLEQMVKIEQLPEHWRREVEDLQNLLNPSSNKKPSSKKWWFWIMFGLLLLGWWMFK